MKAIDRVMRAYLKTRELTEEQIALARTELSKFIYEMQFGPSERSNKQHSE